VDHVYCADNVTPRGPLRSVPGLTVHPVGLAHPFEKYSLLRRTKSEVDVGRKYAAALRAQRPDVVIAANMPVLSLAMLTTAAQQHQRPVVAWLQDIQSGLALTMLPRPLRRLAQVLAHVERKALGQATAVVAISDALAEEIARWRGLDAERITVIENWAPVTNIVPVDKSNPWSRAHDLAGRFTFMYSGTLGRKHQPGLLLQLARQLHVVDPEARVVVISETEEARKLAAAAADEDLGTLVHLPYQPFDELSNALGSADVLVALLEPDASAFCVPSKVTSYMCAARPVLANIPQDNLAAQLLTERSGAGLVSSNLDDFLANARLLHDDTEGRWLRGEAGRRYAEANFRIDQKVDRFAYILTSVIGTRRSG
jgi:colanic acid biosynthesis glycosyl transferase WcaI